MIDHSHLKGTKVKSAYGLEACESVWLYSSDPDQFFDFEPELILEIIEPPKRYYRSTQKRVKFKIDGETREFFTEWKHFKKHTDLI